MMVEHIRKLITVTYDLITSPDIFECRRNNPINTRDDVLKLRRDMRSLILDLRVHLTKMSELVEEIDIIDRQMKYKFNESQLND